MGTMVFLTANDACARYTTAKILPDSLTVYAADTRKNVLRLTKYGGVELTTFDDIVTAMDSTTTSEVITLGCHNGSLVVWDTRSRSHTIIDGHKAAVTVLCKCPVYEIVSGSDDGLIAIWDIRDLREPREYVRSHSHAVTSLHITDSTLISTSIDGSVKIWDLTRSSLLHTHTQLTYSYPIFDAMLTCKQVLYTIGTDGLNILAAQGGLQPLKSQRVEQLNSLLCREHPFTRLLNAQSALFLANHYTIVKLSDQLRIVEQQCRSTASISATEPPPIIELYNDHLLYSLDDKIMIKRI